MEDKVLVTVREKSSSLVVVQWNRK